LRDDQARAAGQFYSEDEYDLSVLRQSGRRLLELGRSCLHRDYRGGMAMYHLWAALAGYVAEHEIEVLFGVASFTGLTPRHWQHPCPCCTIATLPPATCGSRRGNTSQWT
jgi:putative hemolysin